MKPVWVLFGLMVLGVAGAMAWLTVKALEVDRAESHARAERDREADAGRALWRMDSFLTPLLAEEAVRPRWAYDSVTTLGGPKPRKLLSPLARAPDFVKLHFALCSNGELTSPQCPPAAERDWVLSQGLTSDDLQTADRNRAELQKSLRFDALLASLPRLLATEEIASNLSNGLNPTMEQNSAYLALPQEEAQNAGNGNTSQLGNQLAQDFFNRGQAAKNYAARTRGAAQIQNSLPPTVESPGTRTIDGPTLPLWVDSKLIVARRTKVGGEMQIQGCWLDWPALRSHLLKEVQDVFPDAQLTPFDPLRADPNRALATLPVALTLPFPARDLPGSPSPLKWALASAWVGLLLAGLAGGVTLHKVVALSERRAAFVSAVTHELRTPLTTFRLYADMLSGGVISDEQRRQDYLDTLRREADRLSHLVDNVLQYARLERGRPGGRRESMTLEALLERMTARLADRARQAGLELEVAVDGELRSETIQTDPQAVEQILFNLVDNAAKYAAHATDRQLFLEVSRAEKTWRFVVQDHGPGVPAEVRRKLFQPFCKPVDEAARSAPGVGLGLALSRRLAQDLGGRLELTPSDVGARFVLRLREG